MTGATHVITGLATAVAFGRLSSQSPSPVELCVLICGVLAPDIDGGGVITRPGTVLRNFLGRGLGELLDVVFRLVSSVVQLLLGHRGFMHSPAAALLLFAAAQASGRAWVAWFAIGYAVHILGDAMTVGGIPLLSPVSPRRYSLSSLRTGSRREFAVAALLLAGTFVFGWETLPSGVKAFHVELYELIARAQ